MALSSTLKELGSGIAAAYRRYAEWLVSITWKRFFVLSILLLIVTGILSNLPPFNWDIATRSSRVPASRSVDSGTDCVASPERSATPPVSGQPSLSSCTRRTPTSLAANSANALGALAPLAQMLRTA